eukprot:6672346-Prymnesium_polylepis.1
MGRLDAPPSLSTGLAGFRRRGGLRRRASRPVALCVLTGFHQACPATALAPARSASRQRLAADEEVPRRAGGRRQRDDLR